MFEFYETLYCKLLKRWTIFLEHVYIPIQIIIQPLIVTSGPLNLKVIDLMLTRILMSALMFSLSYSESLK